MPAPTPAPAALAAETFAGQPCIRLRHTSGDTALVALQGAQVLSWVAAGQERLYLSPHALLDGQSAIRGGVPVCFPQFNQRGPLPKHGFVRNLAWQPAPHAADLPAADVHLPHAVDAQATTLVLQLRADERTRQWWPQDFDAQLHVTLGEGRLRVALQVHNPGPHAWPFTVALHTYFRVGHIAQVQLHGLQGCARWDAVRDEHHVQHGPIQFASEYDSVFTAPHTPHVPGATLTLHQGHAPHVPLVHISQSPSLGNVVVWNPGEALCARLPDMPADGYQHMLCVEAAHIDTPVVLDAGAHWTGWQQIALG